MRTECLPAAKTLLRSRQLGCLSLRLGCGEPLHGQLHGPAGHRPPPSALAASPRREGSRT
jgi:hypothetical protein